MHLFYLCVPVQEAPQVVYSVLHLKLSYSRVRYVPTFLWLPYLHTYLGIYLTSLLL